MKARELSDVLLKLPTGLKVLVRLSSGQLTEATSALTEGDMLLICTGTPLELLLAGTPDDAEACRLLKEAGVCYAPVSTLLVGASPTLTRGSDRWAGLSGIRRFIRQERYDRTMKWHERHVEKHNEAEEVDCGGCAACAAKEAKHVDHFPHDMPVRVAEKWRRYTWSDGREVKIEQPVYVMVTGGGHWVLDATREGHYVPKGWRHLAWEATADGPAWHGHPNIDVKP